MVEVKVSDKYKSVDAILGLVIEYRIGDAEGSIHLYQNPNGKAIISVTHPDSVVVLRGTDISQEEADACVRAGSDPAYIEETERLFAEYLTGGDDSSQCRDDDEAHPETTPDHATCTYCGRPIWLQGGIWRDVNLVVPGRGSSLCPSRPYGTQPHVPEGA